MLALPIVDRPCRFFPFACDVFMRLGLHDRDRHFYSSRSTGGLKTQVNFVSMAGHLLGQSAAASAGCSICFYFMPCLSPIFQEAATSFPRFFIRRFLWACPFGWAVFFLWSSLAWVVYLGRGKSILWNRVLMVGKILSYFGPWSLSASNICAANAPAPRCLLRSFFSSRSDHLVWLS